MYLFINFILINLFSYCDGSEIYLNYYANAFITEGTVNKFNKYWNFLEIFPPTCTIHFPRQRHTWDDLFHSFLAYCTLNSVDIWCVMLSTYASYNTNVARHQNLTKWGSNEFEDLTPIFTETFRGKRYNGFCVAQVAINRGYSIDYPVDHSYFYSPENLKESKKNLKIYTPDYILNQAYLEEIENIDKTPYITTAFFYSSTIILLLFSEYRIYLNCITCDYDHFQSFLQYKNGLDLTRKSQLVPITKVITLQQISDLLTSLNFEKSTPKPYQFKRDPAKLKCLYEEFFMGRSLWELVFVDFESCIKHLILSSLNSTEFTLHNIVKNTLYLQSYNSVNVNLSVLNHGATTFGIKYSIFTKRIQGQGGSQTIDSLLAPIDLQGWIVAIATVIGIRFLLKWSGFKGSLYWLFSTLIEQGEDQRKYSNKRNITLVIGWLVLAFFLRLVYTSSMYAYLTQESGPQDIPSNFTELLNQTNMNLVFEKSAIRYLEDYEEEKELDNQNFTFLNFENIQRIWEVAEYNTSSSSDGAKFSCIFYSLSRNVSSTADKCMTGKQYSYLYSSGLLLTSRFSKLALVKPYVMIHGGHHISENNEFLLFSSEIFWVCSRKSYFNKWFSKSLSYIVHSGIYNLQIRYARLRSFKQMEKEEINGWERSNTSSHVSSLTGMLNVWMKFECFDRYKEVCASRYDLNEYDDDTDVVHLTDLAIIWMMFYAFLLFCVVIFLFELAK